MKPQFERSGRSAGQVLLFLLVLLPVLIALGGIMVRSGKTLVLNQRLQNHCNKRILDVLAQQALGLQALARLNPVARKVIDMRRKVDRTLESGMAPPYMIPPLLAMATQLRAMQVTILPQQKAITRAALSKSLQVLSRRANVNDRGKIIEVFRPSDPLLPHRSKNSLLLHVQDEPAYAGEIGSPQTLDDDFHLRQRTAGEVTIQTEKFLDFWPNSKPSGNMIIFCEANIEMKTLEDKWKIQLVPTLGRLSSKVF